MVGPDTAQHRLAPLVSRVEQGALVLVLLGDLLVPKMASASSMISVGGWSPPSDRKIAATVASLIASGRWQVPAMMSSVRVFPHRFCGLFSTSRGAQSKAGSA